MRLQLEDGQEVELKFRHDPFTSSTCTPRETCCECLTVIGLETGDFPISTIGRAFCNATDQFNRAIGRRIALTRAIAHFPRAIRTQIWKAYFAYLKPQPAAKKDSIGD